MRDTQTFNPLGDFFRQLTPPAGTAGLPGPWAAYEYALDAWQRSVLLLDVLRQRANRTEDHQGATAARDNDEDAVLGQETARLLTALRRLSEVDAEHYEQHVRPWLEKAMTPVLAHVLVERQGLRLDDAVFSDRNPLMLGVAQLAATVRADRHPADGDNPYLLLQQQLSGLLADVLNTCADLRDQAAEQIYLTLRGLPEWPGLPDFAEAALPAATQSRASVPAARAETVPVAATASRKIVPGKPAVASKPAKPAPTKPAAAKPVAARPAGSAANKPATPRAAKPSRPRAASKQAALPGMTDGSVGIISTKSSPVAATPAVAAIPVETTRPTVAPAVNAPAIAVNSASAKTGTATPPAAPRPSAKPASPAQVRRDAKPAASVASTAKPAVKKTVVAPAGKPVAGTPAAAMAATIAALAVPAENAPSAPRRKAQADKPAPAKSDVAKPVAAATPRKR